MLQKSKLSQLMKRKFLVRSNRNSFSSPKDIEIFINDEKHLVDPRMTIFQACYSAGVIIPRFCYHEKLSVAGNCRMCLVEVEKAPKPVAGCFAQVAPGMKIFTESEKTRLARGAVMEFLLANHPLDCPICDQGGECDLQDISKEYGFEEGRFQEYKRAVEDKNVGPIISTHMTRCIHCTRCIRFAEEIAGFSDLGTVGRGQRTEIGTYVEKMLNSELSGNLADICPVGALTHGPYAFTSRPFELKTTNSIDLMESIIPQVEFYYRGPEIMRTLPRVHENVNDEWISDKSRYAYDGLSRQRLNVPLRRNKQTEQFEELTWKEAMDSIAYIINGMKNPDKDLLGIIGQFTPIETAIALNDFCHKLGSENIASSLYPLLGQQRCDYLLNRSISELDNLDCLLLVGSNPKFETPVMNARITKAVKEGRLKVYKIGSPDDLGYKFVHLGNSSNTLKEILSGNHPFCKRLNEAKNGHIIFGSELSNEIQDFGHLFQTFQSHVNKINKERKEVNSDQNLTIGVLHQFVGAISGHEVGIKYLPIQDIKKPTVVLNFGNDNDQFLSKVVAKNPDAFIVYFGTNGDAGASYADIVLPVNAWTEGSATYVSTEGRVQISRKVVISPGQSKEEWKVIRILSEMVSNQLNYDSLEELRYRMAELAPHLLKYDFLENFSHWGKNIGNKNEIRDFILSSGIDNYYKTDAISRSSLVMAKSSAAYNPSKLSNFMAKIYT